MFSMTKQRVQRRLAAIPATHLVGDCRVTAEDQAGMLAQLRTLREDFLDPETGEQGGRIFKISSDGILSNIASAVPAVQRAIDLQGTMKQCHATVSGERRTKLRL